MKTNTERASAYLARMPVAESGHGGDCATYAAAQVLVRGFSLSQEEALPLLQHWNQGCRPPWSEADLRRKLRSAATSHGREPGYLLKDDRRAAAPQHKGADFQPVNEVERRAWQRSKWPEMRRLRREEMEAIAQLRGIPWCGLYIAHCFGLLKMCRLDGHECYVLREGRFAQARRLDGQPFATAEGRAIKAKNLPGSEGSFVGRSLLHQAPNVLLVEGAVGLLEALTAYALVDMQDSWTVLAATSASSRLKGDAELLRALSGRHVRIVPDTDKAGMDAAAFWINDLRAAGATVSIQELPPGCKDLGILIDAEAIHQEDLDQIFCQQSEA